ncbi:zinc finger protein 333 [Vanessa cardui]|uniref:zinc finger protein 333 n=1 Tax=Vanessa cardui TaxID=171605 RepID=UPI001F13EF1A|nr:zinc finger protein 333 [Vanessa cardui]
MSEIQWGRVMSRRGLKNGCRSRNFSLADLAEIKQTNQEENVYMEMDASGQLTARGGPARAARLARLAPAPPHASALLCLERGPAPNSPDDLRLCLRLTTDAPPLHELLLWFDEHTLAHLNMPFLTLRNITGKKNYACHNCDAEFEQPNPLKIHMFLSCRKFEPDAFWKQCISQLRSSVTTSTTISPLGPSLVSPLSSTLRLGSVPPPATPIADPAQLEALAAAWGRSRDGHICVYCGKLYSRKYGLKIHIRTHTGYKPLRCRHCLRAFGDPSNLNKHVRLHAAADTSRTGDAGALTHACALCHKPLARRRDLLRHLRAHHPQQLSSLPETGETAYAEIR